ncbi:lysylphosphatidylglycerol synthase transmembrane domain-containing protein [Streptomyces chiangmaiensis]|uniref:YbhN family protein n=1 Tax=Streptomyces chiangmaiensis TaxID=766497 RepID=A0ABU7FMR4_9ACTN|nr:YbhN family protein [Streptomyces chiangmaiensis]MED7825420.1 YbhN family protein [Streptomyces chiangmaiensis]
MSDLPVPPDNGHPTPAGQAEPATDPKAVRRPRWQVWAWWTATVVVVALAVAGGVSHRHELAGTSHLLTHVSVPKLAVALAFEAASFVSLAALQRWLLRGAETRPGQGTMTGLAFAANAMAGALPGGSALSVAWAIRQLRRRDIGLALAAAMLVVAGALSVLALALLLTLGALVADPAGPGSGLRTVVLLTAVVLAAVIVSVVCLTRSSGLRRSARHAGRRVTARWRAGKRLGNLLADVLHQAESIQPGLRGWTRPCMLALLNWLCDAAALVACLWALGIGVPWRGMLVSYGLAQISISLRLTPGSLGIAEASLSTLLVVQGLRADQAIAAALLYRVVSSWAVQPIGWACWFRLTLRDTRPLTRTIPWDPGPPAANGTTRANALGQSGASRHREGHRNRHDTPRDR